ncbi:hypothetical protein [Psychroserpens luteolus]|uniref:hypothetical protein n=1 Tax=Psychroserpens luteolus TaxID=2855840 RepID=UPI001E370F47|nr:hypothetical protein [Psychroserpens luteolus]MCD2258376.1 hypothetical protein [Psychroserpens luteolus]
MRRKVLLLLVIVICNMSYSQERDECDLLSTTSVATSALKFNLREITAKNYNSNKISIAEKFSLISNSDSIENVLKSKYPKLFKKKNNKFVFETFDGKNITVHNNLVQDKTYMTYTFKALYKNYVIIFQNYYEGSSSILIDTKTNAVYLLPDKPYFITDTLVYSYGHYNGGTDLTILDIGKNKALYFTFDNIWFESTYYLSTDLKFKVKCMASEETKYLEVFKY